MIRVSFVCEGESFDPVEVPHVPRIGEHIITLRGVRQIVVDVVTQIPDQYATAITVITEIDE